MASICSRIAVLCTISTLLAAVCSAAHSAAAPAVDCSSLVLSMADCLTFVAEGSIMKKPEGTCCSGLKSVLKTDANCLCEAFRNSAQLGMTINVTKALTLPKACHVAAPPSVSNCAVNIGTGAAPAEAPVAASPSSVAGAPPATGIIANVTPVPVHSGSSSSSDASSVLAPIVLLIVASAAAASFSLS